MASGSSDSQPTAAAAAPAAGPARIRVRMYRQGLGDCFLVSILRAPKPFHIMIDCGVILGSKNAGEVLTNVVKDIIATTGGAVDVLVVTHEHYDHVAGFNLAEPLFAKPGETKRGETNPAKLSVGEVWFAWTEDPENAFAQQLRSERDAHVSALSALAGRLAGLGVGLDNAPATAGALQFLGIGPDGKTGATAGAMAKAKALAPVRYYKPGDQITPAGAPELRIYVLGPPMDRPSLVKTDSPTEVYHLAGLRNSVDGLLGEGRLLNGRNPGDPFDQVWASNLSKAAEPSHAGFLHEHYFGPETEPPHEDLAWRRIDGAWLDDAEELALALDSYTNNTSLALAIELVATGEVLLFPADAQVGNWLSWDRQSWMVGGKDVTTADLLGRTIFYKVGHHGSHNATLKAKGLERMPDQGLTAFIPVDHDMAVIKHWGQMPLPALVAELQRRCGPQLARIDAALPPKAADIQAGGTGGPFDSLYYEWSHTISAKA